MSAPVAILAVGNASRGDDAVGPMLAARLRDWLAAEPLGERFELIEEYQLQIENALDLEGRRLALFIDARRGAAKAVDFRPVCEAGEAAVGVSHQLEPGAVLAVLGKVSSAPRPAAFSLGVRAGAFELGQGLSPGAEAAAEEAWRLLCRLLRHPQAQAWQAIADEGEVRGEGAGFLGMQA